MTYSEKLKHPQWQKMRLKILERDKFSCQYCLSTEKTLHVHHKYYSKRFKNPWDYDVNDLITLCNTCHEIEGLVIAQKKILIEHLKQKYGHAPIFCHACGNRDYNNFQVRLYHCRLCGWETYYDEYAAFINSVEEAMNNV